MGEALAWIGQIAEWFGRFIPRLTIVTTTHGWVKWVRGWKVKSGGAGLVIHWPVVTELVTFPIARQGNILDSQTITTLDNVNLAVNLVVIYEVEDLEALLTQTQNADSTIGEMCLTAAQDVLTATKWEDIRLMKRSKLHTELRGRAQSVLKQYGVKVIKVFLKDLAPCKVYRILGNSEGDSMIPLED